VSTRYRVRLQRRRKEKRQPGGVNSKHGR